MLRPSFYPTGPSDSTMISAFANIFKIPELRQRVLFTLAMLAVVRVGAAITMPGVDPVVVQGYLDDVDRGAGNALNSLITAFSGGVVASCSILALGIMPYISASIMVQLLTAVVPKLSKLSREAGGRQKITQYTRYVTIVLCIIQGYMMARGLVHPEGNFFLSGMDKFLDKAGLQLVSSPSWGFYAMAVTIMTAGTLFLMWLGEQITERGIGNGTSLLISVNILSELPFAMVNTFKTLIREGDPTKAMILVGLICLFVISVAGIITITQATRKIAINYAKRMVGRKVMGGQSTHLPIRLNYSGVMPIIFASAIIGFPPMILGLIWPNSEWVMKFNSMMSTGGWIYWTIELVLIFFFAYFWVATMFQPTQISEDLKSSGGYVPGIRPGKPTADFLDYTMSRLTFAGATFLALVAILPQIMTFFWRDILPPQSAQFFGGTSILILVGVLLDVMRQIETHLLQRNYDGFLRKGRIRGRYESDGTPKDTLTAQNSRVVLLYVVLAVLILIGIGTAIYKQVTAKEDRKAAVEQKK
jgi:preprotein translocase subunit SecY